MGRASVDTGPGYGAGISGYRTRFWGRAMSSIPPLNEDKFHNGLIMDSVVDFIYVEHENNYSILAGKVNFILF